MSDREAGRGARAPASAWFSRRSLLATTGMLAGAMAIGGRFNVARADPPSSTGVTSAIAQPSGTGRGPVRFPEGFLWGTASSAESVPSVGDQQAGCSSVISRCG